MANRIQAFVVNDEIDGEELENFNAKRLQKSLKKAEFADWVGLALLNPSVLERARVQRNASQRRIASCTNSRFFTRPDSQRYENEEPPHPRAHDGYP